MAKKHVAFRYVQAENEYLEMRELIKELDNELKNNNIDQEFYNERVEMLSDEIEKTKLQYFFWAEALYELNRPNRPEKDFDTTTQAWYNVLQTQTKELLKDTGNNATTLLKQILKEGRKNGQK